MAGWSSLLEMRDLDSYLRRIHITGPCDLASLHLAHTTSIVFENLDPLQGRPNSLQLDDLEDKIVRRRRGGYCFEQNMLFWAAIDALDLGTVEPILARTRTGGRPGPRPRTHLLLRVTNPEGCWHVDVGFGADGLLEPIPFGVGAIASQHGWRYRVVRDANELVLQLEVGGEFVDLYGFIDEPAPLIDIEVSNWYVATHPRSPFTHALYCSTQTPGERNILSERTGRCMLTTKRPEAISEREIDPDFVPEILATTFSLPGVTREEGVWRLHDETVASAKGVPLR